VDLTVRADRAVDASRQASDQAVENDARTTAGDSMPDLLDAQVGCYDEDGTIPNVFGEDTKVKAKTTGLWDGEYTTVTDYCLASGEMVEHCCRADGTIGLMANFCLEGYSCVDGACVPS